MAARIADGAVQLLTRSGVDWTDKYPSTAAALTKLKVRSAYLDGDLCGVRPDGVYLVRTHAAGVRQRRRRADLFRVRRA
jgi:ATP-dependent DNA ligase